MAFATTPETFADVFAASGARDASLAVDATGRSRGYGIVAFHSVEDARDAVVAFDGVMVDGRPMRCRLDRFEEGGG